MKLILSVIDTYEPSHVWISTECGPFSPMQNLNQRTEKQQEELRENDRMLFDSMWGRVVCCIMLFKRESMLLGNGLRKVMLGDFHDSKDH